MSPGPDQPVTRADIEHKLAQIRGIADDSTEVADGAAVRTYFTPS